MGDERSRQERKSPWGGDFKRRGKHLGEGIRWRKGVSVFVDRVSKRIHRLTLKEAFSVYGNVIDVYIAYNNSRRINKAYTFAFIRFLTLDEARRAVDRAHNRRMDGFFIRVFMGKEQQSNVSAKNINECRRGPKSISEDNLVAKVISNKSVDKSRVFMYTNGRSYKEVLMSKPMSNPGDDVDRQGLEEATNPDFTRKEINFEPFNFSIPKADLVWLEHCLVGQVKGMYDAHVVQQALCSEGFRVKVSVWSGFYVIIQFEEEEQIQIFWDLKDSMLGLWFDDIDSVDHFIKNKKLKVWLILGNVPLAAWNESVFVALTNRWGSFISVEDDTSKRVRLDKARILVGVSQVSDIPQSTNIFINGEKFCIRVSVAAFEDHRCSIDALGTQANVDVMVENQGDGDESGKFEANNLVENNLEVGLAQSGQSQVQIGDSEGLVDIPIAQQSGSSKFSDESSEAHLPLLDKESGLFKVRPKYLRSARNSSKLSFRSKVDKALWWASPNFTPVPSKQKRDKGKSSSSMSVSVALDRPSSRSNQEDYNEEIQAILETCKALEIRFKGGDEAVSKRILLSWNVRGFKRKEKIKAARDLLARVKPSVGFFQETKLDQVNGNFGRKLWGNLHRCVVSSPAIGSVGGLISTWDPEFFSVSDRIINQRFIVLVETLTNGNHSFGFVNVYGPSIDSAKTEFFEELYKVIAKFNVAWVVGGDFNAFLNPEEKLGLSLNSFSMNVFKEFVGNMQGIDLPLCGGAFTWCNNRDPPTFVKLDRFIVTADVLLKFPNICQVLLPRAISDHNAILLHYTPVNWGPKPFKIFNYWVHKAGFDDLMASVFSNHNSNGSHKGIGALLRDSKKAIKAWRESQCQDRNVSIDKLVASINEMEGKIQSGVLPSSAMIEVASLRRKKNQISCLTVGSRVVSDPKIVKEAVKSHFSLEFNHVSTLEVESLNLPFTKLRPEQAGLLESIFTEEELWVSIVSRWGVSLVLHRNPLQFMVGWPHICSKLSRDTLWLLTAFAIVWTLWLHQNDIIFQGKSCDLVQLVFNAKLRATWWWKARNIDSSILLDSIIADPSLPSSIGEASHVSRAFWCWSPPPLGFLKYNIDGACSLEGRCGVGGVLRDENGSTLMEFSLSIGYGSALLAEILAIKFAVERFMSSLWIDRSRLVIESDSSTAVAWVLNPSLASLPFSELVHGIHPFFSDGRWVIRHIRRIQNVHADFLAKAGIG
ncbi:hypothetical protein V6N11_011581 [Hibiscus sabdariffa]|uniref:RRM domain-containing protein n=1 Tax=Hibiscus sabdariffa TaxID=183260 RepID=A0ABR2S8P8_9ROSI